MTAQPLPELLGVRELMTELGIARGPAYTLISQLPRTRIAKRVFVKRSDVHAYLDANSVDRDGMPVQKSAAA